MLRDLASAIAETRRYEEALQVARSIDSDWVRVDALSSVAAALARAGDDQRADEVFDEELEVARSIVSDWDRAEALGYVAAALTRAGDERRARELSDEELEVARSIGDDWWSDEVLNSVEATLSVAGDARRAEALRSEAAALARAERYEEALQVARSIEVSVSGDDQERVDALKDLASTLAEAERLNYALAVLGLHELDVFLQALASWAPSFERVEPGLSFDVLREATSIAGWMHSDWRDLYELLNS